MAVPVFMTFKRDDYPRTRSKLEALESFQPEAIPALETLGMSKLLKVNATYVVD